jgi:phosphoribosylanthranilate isomerase
MTRRTRIKICGLTREVDVAAAVERAAELARSLPPFVTPVGLFVNAGASHIEAAVRAIPNLVLQFHGDERPDDCWQAGRPYLRAARMAPGFDLLNFALQYPDAQAVLLDAHVEGYGGSGKVFDWSLIPHGVSRPVVLSGGLHAENVIEGIFRVRPWAVDVSSGVESAKGIKDAAAIRRFCDAVREADVRLAANPT